MKLSELEGAVLGTIWRKAPCSAYRVKREFADSPSASWSASAGSIYPLVRKLAAGGLLRVAEEPWGKGTKTLLSLSDEGLRTLQAWLTRLTVGAATVPPDPIRTRILFLDALPEHRRAVFLEMAAKETQAASSKLATEVAGLDASSISFNSIAIEGAIAQLEARHDWLCSTRRKLAALASSEG